MARIVLGVGTSHSPVLSMKAEEWPEYAKGDYRHPELIDPSTGTSVSYEELEARAPASIREKPNTEETVREQHAACQRGIQVLSETFNAVKPDITVIISDDQDEMFFDTLMPMFAVYWGDSIPIRPIDTSGMPPHFQILKQALHEGYGDRELEVPVARVLGRHIIESFADQGFDVARFDTVKEQYGGKVSRYFPKEDGGEHVFSRNTEPRSQGLPHGFSFVVKRLFGNEPRTILPIFQNTCYPPNQPRPWRSYQLGQALERAIQSWEQDARVAIVASGGLSHFVVDETLDRMTLKALEEKDKGTLQNLPRHRLLSAASETQNWVSLGGAMENTDLRMELIEYVPAYRTPAGTGGGWAFARWL